MKIAGVVCASGTPVSTQVRPHPSWLSRRPCESLLAAPATGSPRDMQREPQDAGLGVLVGAGAVLHLEHVPVEVAAAAAGRAQEDVGDGLARIEADGAQVAEVAAELGLVPGVVDHAEAGLAEERVEQIEERAGLDQLVPRRAGRAAPTASR